ncbi:hypothetical protein [Aedoeadaptatus urinae]|uniref:hypothetical protein n=1 Tax=Aedoeadaptatus urinae TaxID=1871017 RepID=UPI00097D0589|nr:hypothetical protein [Peptoniphilus urinae]
METVDVYQSEINQWIPMEYIGTMQYIGKDDPLSFTDGKVYTIVRDKNRDLKVVDDTDEDYLYNLNAPNDLGGQFFYLDDPYGILARYIERAR